MATVVYRVAAGLETDGAGEGGLVFLPALPIAVEDAVLLAATVFVGSLDADTTAIHVRYRRGNTSDPQIGPTFTENIALLDSLPNYLPVGPVVDTPGYDGDNGYCVTIETEGASGPSTGIYAVLSATWGDVHPPVFA